MKCTSWKIVINDQPDSFSRKLIWTELTFLAPWSPYRLTYTAGWEHTLYTMRRIFCVLMHVNDFRCRKRTKPAIGYYDSFVRRLRIQRFSQFIFLFFSFHSAKWFDRMRFYSTEQIHLDKMHDNRSSAMKWHCVCVLCFCCNGFRPWLAVETKQK